MSPSMRCWKRVSVIRFASTLTKQCKRSKDAMLKLLQDTTSIVPGSVRSSSSDARAYWTKSKVYTTLSQPTGRRAQCRSASVVFRSNWPVLQYKRCLFYSYTVYWPRVLSEVAQLTLLQVQSVQSQLTRCGTSWRLLGSRC